MKLSRKNVGRIATTFLATAMLASLTAVPAMAVDGDGTGGETGDNVVWNEGEITQNEDGSYSIELSKELLKRKSVTTPNVFFKVEIIGAVSQKEYIDGIPVLNGVDDAVNAEAGDDLFAFSHTDETLPADVVQPNNGQDSDNTVTVQFDPSEFTEPGIYKYGVSETTVDEAGNPITYEGITNDEAFMYVYVEEAGLDKDGTMQYKITNVVLTHQDTVLGKIGQLTNRYGVDPDKDPDGTVNDLILTKKVTGNQGDTQKKFDFTITIIPSETENTFHIVYGTYDDDGVWHDSTAPEDSFVIGKTDRFQVQVSLSDGEYVRVYGLSENDKYIITETDYSGLGYQTQYVISGTKLDDYTDVTFTDGTSTGEQTVDVGTELKIDYVTFENDREASTPTGIVTNVAPYALLVVIAAAGCFVFLRKRDED